MAEQSQGAFLSQEKGQGEKGLDEGNSPSALSSELKSQPPPNPLCDSGKLLHPTKVSVFSSANWS